MKDLNKLSLRSKKLKKRYFLLLKLSSLLRKMRWSN